MHCDKYKKTDKNIKIEQVREVQKKTEQMGLDNRYNIDQWGIDSLMQLQVESERIISVCAQKKDAINM